MILAPTMWSLVGSAPRRRSEGAEPAPAIRRKAARTHARRNVAAVTLHGADAGCDLSSVHNALQIKPAPP
jgi:hypothetical protein